MIIVKSSLACRKQVNPERARWVVLDEGLGQIVDPRGPDGLSGCFPIGSDCWRRHPELHPYEAV